MGILEQVFYSLALPPAGLKHHEVGGTQPPLPDPGNLQSETRKTWLS